MNDLILDIIYKYPVYVFTGGTHDLLIRIKYKEGILVLDNEEFICNYTSDELKEVKRVIFKKIEDFILSIDLRK